MNYAGNWVSYNLYVEQAGDYNLMFNVANGREGFDWNVGVEVGDTVVENDILTVPQTGDGDGEGEWYNFEDVGPVTVALEEGNNIVTLRCSETNKYPNIDYITFNKADTASASTPMRARALAANVSNADPAEKIMLLDVYEGRATMDDFLAQITNEQRYDGRSAEYRRCEHRWYGQPDGIRDSEYHDSGWPAGCPHRRQLHRMADRYVAGLHLGCGSCGKSR